MWCFVLTRSYKWVVTDRKSSVPFYYSFRGVYF